MIHSLWHLMTLAFSSERARAERRLWPLGLVLGLVLMGQGLTPAYGAQKLEMKVLILSGSNGEDDVTAVRHIKNSLDAHNVRYDHLQLMRNGRRVYKGKLPLQFSSKHGRYYGIVTTTAQLSYKTRSGNYETALTPDQWRQLDAYRRTFGVRTVVNYAYPTDDLGVKAVESLVGEKRRPLKLKSPVLSIMSGLKFNGATLENSWVYPARLLSRSTAKPFLYVTAGRKDYVAAFTQRLNTGVERMVFLFSQNEYVAASAALAQLWVPWLTKGVYLGKRRSYMGLQVDDFMLNNFRWDATANKNPYSLKRVYRNSPADMAFNISWQQKMSPYFVNGLKMELAYNGAGYDRFPRNQVDHLRAAMKGKEWNFWWLNHTYSHPNLDKLSYQVVRNEVDKNFKFGRRHFRKILRSHFSDYHIVTPEISGLFNKNAMRAMKDLGVESVTGDNSRPELKPVNTYFGRYTEKAKNGVDGIFIMPRHAAEVYWDVVNIPEQVSQYNKTYRKEIGRDLNIEEIMAREGERTAIALLSLDPAPYMFHFPNIARIVHKGKPTTLIAMWVEAALKKYHTYTRLPIMNLPMKKIVDVYQDRIRQRQCLKSATLTIAGKKYASMTLKTTPRCAVQVTSSRDLVGAAAPKRFGPDRTYTVSSSGTKVVRFK